MAQSRSTVSDQLYHMLHISTPKKNPFSDISVTSWSPLIRKYRLKFSSKTWSLTLLVFFINHLLQIIIMGLLQTPSFSLIKRYMIFRHTICTGRGMREFWLILAKGEIWSTKECSKKRGQVNWQELCLFMRPGFQKAAESTSVFSFCGCIVMKVEEDFSCS